MEDANSPPRCACSRNWISRATFLKADASKSQWEAYNSYISPSLWLSMYVHPLRFPLKETAEGVLRLASFLLEMQMYKIYESVLLT